MKVESNIAQTVQSFSPETHNVFSSVLKTQNLAMRRGQVEAGVPRNLQTSDTVREAPVLSMHGRQMANPHHPVMDALPAVSLRNRLEPFAVRTDISPELRQHISDYMRQIDGLLFDNPLPSALNSLRPLTQGGQGSALQTPVIRRAKRAAAAAVQRVHQSLTEREPQTRVNHVEGNPPLHKKQGAPALTSLLQVKMIEEDLAFLDHPDYAETGYKAVKAKYLDAIPQGVRERLAETASPALQELREVLQPFPARVSIKMLDEVIEANARLRCEANTPALRSIEESA